MLMDFVSMEVDMRNGNGPQDGAITCQKLGVSLPDLLASKWHYAKLQTEQDYFV